MPKIESQEICLFTFIVALFVGRISLEKKSSDLCIVYHFNLRTFVYEMTLLIDLLVKHNNTVKGC